MSKTLCINYAENPDNLVLRSYDLEKAYADMVTKDLIDKAVEAQS